MVWKPSYNWGHHLALPGYPIGVFTSLYFPIPGLTFYSLVMSRWYCLQGRAPPFPFFS